jgi:hypothetical protein
MWVKAVLSHVMVFSQNVLWDREKLTKTLARPQAKIQAQDFTNKMKEC